MVEITPQERKNPLDPEAPSKFYAQAISSGSTDLNRLAHLISNQSTVRKPDCMAVLEALVHNISDELSEGRSVKLGDFGIFSIGVRSNGEETPEEVNANTVKKAHLNFRPGKGFHPLLRNAKFKLVS